MKPSTCIFGVKQRNSDSVANQLFNSITHRTRAELRVKSFSHEKGENSFIQAKRMAACRKEFDFTRKKLLSDLQLVLVAQPMKNELFVDAGEDFRPKRLLSARENVPFESRNIRVL